MFNNHTMSVVTDLSLIAQQLNNTQFMTVAAITTSPYPTHPNIYNAAILMPPTELLMMWADLPANEGYFLMQNEYPKYLMQKDPDDMLIALIAAMTKRNIVLFIPNDEFNVFGMALLNHIYYMYGITCNYMNTTFNVDSSKIPFIISKFYMCDLMEPNDYLASYPANMMLPEFVIQKLAIELQPLPGQPTFNDYANYFNQLNASKLPAPVQMVKIVDGDPK